MKFFRLSILLLALSLFGALFISNASRPALAGGNAAVTKISKCVLWVHKGRPYEFRVRFWGAEGKHQFKVSSVEYIFETRSEFNPGDRSNIDISRGSRTIWSSPDALETDSRWHVYRAQFTLPTDKRIKITGIADHRSAGDPTCSLRTRI